MYYNRNHGKLVCFMYSQLLNILFLKIGGSFVDKLEDEQGEFVQFEYVKSIGHNICPLNLYGGKEPSGENIYTMCKQGPCNICTGLSSIEGVGS